MYNKTAGAIGCGGVVRSMHWSSSPGWCVGDLWDCFFFVHFFSRIYVMYNCPKRDAPSCLPFAPPLSEVFVVRPCCIFLYAGVSVYGSGRV